MNCIIEADYIELFLHQELISSLLILFFLLRRPLQKSLRLYHFKSIWDEIWQMFFFT